MLSAKPWKADAIIRLILSVFVCVYAGSLAMSIQHYVSAGARARPPAWPEPGLGAGKGPLPPASPGPLGPTLRRGEGPMLFFPAAAVALICLAATLVLVGKPWPMEKVPRRLLALLVFGYGGLFLGAWAQELAGAPRNEASIWRMVAATLSFQGVGLILIARFLREQQTSWAEGFGFGNHLRQAVLLGVLAAVVFLPLGWGLQQASALVMTHLPHFKLHPEEQLPVHALRVSVSWGGRLTLGAAAVFLAPVTEEMLFRGILYPAIKQRGYPQLALWGTSLLFAAVHMNAVTFLPLAVLALVLTGLYEWTDNLLGPDHRPCAVQRAELRHADGLRPNGRHMNELELIRRLTHSLPTNPTVVVGAGDDCAVLDAGVPDQLLLFKTDAVVESVHFTSATPPEKIGHKALGRCLSDIAAMAGTPTAALVTIGLPRGFNPDTVEAIYTGLNSLARRHHVAVVGGETTASPGGIFISVALLGWAPRGKCALRSGAEAGDAIFVTGELGGSLAGKHLEFEPRLAEARWLAEHFTLHAMLDISDGLAGDLRHLLAASRVGAELLATSIPISLEARRAAKASSSAKPPLLAALTDGEDFELLFTVASRDAVPLLDAWRAQFAKLPLTCVGKIKAGEGITIRDKDSVRPLTAHGYDHFA